MLSTPMVTGDIVMASSGLPSAVTDVNVSLSGLNRVAGGYHVHQYPLNTRNPGDNICGTTGGHYNPLGVYNLWLFMWQYMFYKL